jgi:hypothetical protein
MDDLHGSVTALATPFRAGQLDVPALAALTERQLRRGTAGLVACGSTGEAAALSVAKQALDRIAAIYAIETAPLLDAFFVWGEAALARLSAQGCSTLWSPHELEQVVDACGTGSGSAPSTVSGIARRARQ